MSPSFRHKVKEFLRGEKAQDNEKGEYRSFRIQTDSLLMSTANTEELSAPQANHQRFLLDTANVDSYTYTPLKEPRSIRLLHFPGDEFQIQPVNELQKLCKLESYSLDEAPPYLALSYVWKAPRLDQECIAAYQDSREWFVTSDNAKSSRVKVGRNLYEGLKRVTQGDWAVRYIWVDALCINQDDNAEKASQVALMDAIYTNCQNVLIWLGEMDLQDAENISFLHSQTGPQLNKYLEEQGMQSILTTTWTEKSFNEQFGLGNISRASHWTSYCTLYHNYSWVRATIPIRLKRLTFLVYESMGSARTCSCSTSCNSVFSLRGQFRRILCLGCLSRDDRCGSDDLPNVWRK